MKKDLSKTGFSLLELIVASALVLIVIMGIFAINSVLSNSNQDYGQRSLVKSETQTTLNHILNNASLAIGSGLSDSGGNPDLGIVWGTCSQSNWSPPYASSGSMACTLCIHQDVPNLIPDDTNPNPTAGSFGNGYPNSRWLCYTWYAPVDHNTPYQIKYCAEPFVAGSGPDRGAERCDSTGVSSKYLGTAYGASLPSLITPFTSMSFNSTSGFSLSLQNCFNNSAATCFSSAAPADPVNNPQVTLNGSVFPPQEGMQQN